MIRALIFDIDGVLADTVPISLLLTAEYYASKGYEIGEDDIRPHLGVGMKELLLGPGRDKGLAIDLDDALSFFRSRYSSFLAKGRSALPGGKALIEEARRSGAMTAVASSAPLWRVEANLNAIGVSMNELDAAVTGEDVKRNKPCPDVYSLALVRLGIDPDEAVVFEDSPGGLRSAIAAGCRSVLLETTLSEEKALESEADAVIPDLSAFPSFSSIDELDEAFRKLSMSEERMEAKAVAAAFRALENSYSPYSKFRVGAAVASSSGKVYSGSNVENASYGATICAERSALLSAASAEGKIDISLFAVASECDSPAYPCGECLQVLAEFSRPDTKAVLAYRGGRMRMDFSDLFPYVFDLEKAKK